MENIDTRLRKIEQRLSSIEKFVAENIIPSKQKDPITIPKTTPVPVATVIPVEKSAKTILESLPTDTEYHYDYKSDIDKQKASRTEIHVIDNSMFNKTKKTVAPDNTLFAAVASIFFVLASAFVIKLVIDLGWLTPIRQISLAGMIAAGMIGLGYLLRDYDYTAIGYIPIVGIIVLFLDVYGATNYYQIMPKNLGVMSVLAIAMISVYLFKEFKLELYQIIAVLGAYIVPLYISYETNIVFTNFYYLLASLIFMTMSFWLGLLPVATLAAYISIAICGISDYVDNDPMNRVLFTLGHFIIFSGGYVLQAIRSKKVLARIHTFTFFPFIIFFYAMEYYYIDAQHPYEGPIFAALLIGLLYSLYYVGKKYAPFEKLVDTATMLFSSSVVILIHCLFFVLLPAKMRSIFLVLFAFAVYKLGEQISDNWDLFKKFVTYIILALFTWNSFEVLISQFSSTNHLPVVNGAIYALVLIYISIFIEKINHLRVNSTLVLNLAHMFSYVTLFNITKNKSDVAVIVSMLIYTIFAAGYWLYKSRNIKLE